MKFSLIICTYMRPKVLIDLLTSVKTQILYPSEILIIDGSINNETQEIITVHNFKNLIYYKVDTENRGLTRQRNFGIDKVNESSKIVCFLDDDIILETNYFELLINTYTIKTDAIGVGGYITNEVIWRKKKDEVSFDEYEIDGFIRKLGKRNEIRKKLGLLSDHPPGFIPKFSNGFPVSYLPPSNKTYEVEHFMGGVSSYRKSLFKKLSFSTYFDGYGLYEDVDFCLRVAQEGKLYVNTEARVEHHHNEQGRPSSYKYGKMVVRNGWYVWRLKFPNPSLKARLKWNAIVLLQLVLRGLNVFTSNKKQEALYEVIGRKLGLISLLFNRPKIQR